MNSLDYVVTFTIYFLSVFLSVTCIKRAERLQSKLYSFLGVIIPVITATFRESGVDFFTYKDVYNHIHAGGDYYMESGWMLLNRLAPSYEWLLFFAALIFYGASYIAICKFGLRDKWMSWLVILVTCTGFFYNCTRQAMAVAIVFLGISFFQKEKFLRFALCVALASLFHKSAVFPLLIIPIYRLFIRRIKKIGLTTLLLSCIAIVSVPILKIALNYFDIFTGYLDGGEFNFSISFLLYTLPPLFYYAKNTGLFKNDKTMHFCLTLYILVIPMQVFGMSIEYADRIMMYFQMMLAIVVPLIIHRYDEVYKNNNLRTIYVLWFIFHHIVMGIVLNENGIYPYRDFGF